MKKPAKKPVSKKVSAPKKAVKTKQAKKTLTEAQVTTLLDKFYEHVENSILDTVFEKSKPMLEEMFDFVAKETLTGLKYPVVDKDLEDRVLKVMAANAKTMAQDLILEYVEALMKKDEEEEPAQNDDFNAKRGL